MPPRLDTLDDRDLDRLLAHALGQETATPPFYTTALRCAFDVLDWVRDQGYEVTICAGVDFTVRIGAQTGRAGSVGRALALAVIPWERTRPST